MSKPTPPRHLAGTFVDGWEFTPTRSAILNTLCDLSDASDAPFFYAVIRDVARANDASEYVVSETIQKLIFSGAIRSLGFVVGVKCLTFDMTTEFSILDINPRARAIVDAIKQGHHVVAYIAQAMGIYREGVANLLPELLNEGIIVRQTNNRMPDTYHLPQADDGREKIGNAKRAVAMPLNDVEMSLLQWLANSPNGFKRMLGLRHATLADEAGDLRQAFKSLTSLRMIDAYGRLTTLGKLVVGGTQ